MSTQQDSGDNEVLKYRSNLIFEHGEPIDLDLADEGRSLLYSGKLLQKSDSHLKWPGSRNWTDLFVLLFDNHLVVTKPKEVDGTTKYDVFCKPISLDFLASDGFTEPPKQDARFLGTIDRLFGHNLDPNSPEVAGLIPPKYYPFTIEHSGRANEARTLFADSAESRDEWKVKLEEAVKKRRDVLERNKVFDVKMIDVETGASTSAPSTTAVGPEGTQMSKVTCVVPFTPFDGHIRIAIGSAEGLWVGFPDDAKSMRRVLDLKQVTQCAVLEDYGIFLVLADQSLYAYKTEALIAESDTEGTKVPQKLSHNKKLRFFGIGVQSDKTFVVTMHQKGLDSCFGALEVVAELIHKHTSEGNPTPQADSSDWFKVHRMFYLSHDCHDVIFLRARLAIMHAKGFEIMDLQDSKSVTIPDRDHAQVKKLLKRYEGCKPLGMFKARADEFLLCYDRFGLYVDQCGDPSRDCQAVEWEAVTAEYIAFHAPYILLFSLQFVEVRHVETGKLVQVVRGEGASVRCVWDGSRGVRRDRLDELNSAGEGHDSDVGEEKKVVPEFREPRVYGVMTGSVAEAAVFASGRDAPSLQRLFELVPITGNT